MADQQKHPTKAERKASARERVEEMRRADERKRKITLVAVAMTVVVVCLAAIFGITYAVQNRSVKKSQEGIAPTNVTDVGAVVMAAQTPSATPSSTPSTSTSTTKGSTSPSKTPTTSPTATPGKPVVITEYFDFICPACKSFNDALSQTLDSMRAQGLTTIEYVPLGLLDGYSRGSEYSTRAAAAAYCVAEDNHDLFPKFVEKMYANQPAEQTTGLTTEQIRDHAREIGASEAAQQCVMDQTYAGYVRRTTSAAQQRGINGTPTLFVDGQKFDGKSWADLLAAIQQAHQKSNPQQPTTTPKP